MPDLITVIQQYSALDDQAAFLVAAFVLSAWTRNLCQRALP